MTDLRGILPSRLGHQLVRPGLVILALVALSVGLPATFVPHAFYLDFPGFAHWVEQLPPYNEHLTTDVGELELAFGLLFAWAAWRPTPALVIPICLVWALSQSVHLIFHAGHLHGLSSLNALAELSGLALSAILPLGVALAVSARTAQTAQTA